MSGDREGGSRTSALGRRLGTSASGLIVAAASRGRPARAGGRWRGGVAFVDGNVTALGVTGTLALELLGSVGTRGVDASTEPEEAHLSGDRLLVFANVGLSAVGALASEVKGVLEENLLSADAEGQ